MASDGSGDQTRSCAEGLTATAMPMFQRAVKEKLKARVAIDGPTGSGKTWTALQLARILVGPDGVIGVFDTENRSAAYYAPSPGQLAGTEPFERINFYDAPYVFGHAPISPPYSPVQLVEMIRAAVDEVGPDGVIVIDSLTHFWTGEGGTLDIVDAAASRGNSFTGWKEGTPAQRHMLDTIIHAGCHVVVTMRSKMEYVLDEVVKNGKTTQVPRKIGMAPEQRAGIEYEFTVVGDMDLEHRLVISKSRCSLIADRVAPIGRSAEVWQTFRGWLDSGVERITIEHAKALVDTMNTIPNEQDRTAIKRAFVDEFGKPAEVTTDRVAEVLTWLTARIDQPSPPGPIDDAADVEVALAVAARFDNASDEIRARLTTLATTSGRQLTARDFADHPHWRGIVSEVLDELERRTTPDDTPAEPLDDVAADGPEEVPVDANETPDSP